jgi:hypothetical protein
MVSRGKGYGRMDGPAMGPPRVRASATTDDSERSLPALRAPDGLHPIWSEHEEPSQNGLRDGSDRGHAGEKARTRIRGPLASRQRGGTRNHTRHRRIDAGYKQQAL